MNELEGGIGGEGVWTKTKKKTGKLNFLRKKKKKKKREKERERERERKRQTQREREREREKHVFMGVSLIVSGNYESKKVEFMSLFLLFFNY